MRRSNSIAEQAANPRGILGWIIGLIMSKETSSDNTKAIELLGIQQYESVVDIGTGHGQSLGRIAQQAAGGMTIGVDTSEVMLGIARRKNKSDIDDDLIQVLRASGSNLPFKDQSIDKALAVHTIYFWNPAHIYLDEIARVLKIGGRFVLAYRPADDKRVVSKFPASIYRFRTISEMSALVRNAGFVEIEMVYRDTPGKPMVWLHLEKADNVIVNSNSL